MKITIGRRKSSPSATPIITDITSDWALLVAIHQAVHCMRAGGWILVFLPHVIPDRSFTLCDMHQVPGTGVGHIQSPECHPWLVFHTLWHSSSPCYWCWIETYKPLRSPSISLWIFYLSLSCCDFVLFCLAWKFRKHQFPFAKAPSSRTSNPFALFHAYISQPMSTLSFWGSLPFLASTWF